VVRGMYPLGRPTSIETGLSASLFNVKTEGEKRFYEAKYKSLKVML
jgi:hypothetical protein